MIKNNQNNLSIILWDFNKYITSDRNTGVISKGVPNGSNIGVDIDV